MKLILPVISFLYMPNIALAQNSLTYDTSISPLNAEGASLAQEKEDAIVVDLHHVNFDQSLTDSGTNSSLDFEGNSTTQLATIKYIHIFSDWLKLSPSINYYQTQTDSKVDTSPTFTYENEANSKFKSFNLNTSFSMNENLSLGLDTYYEALSSKDTTTTINSSQSSREFTEVTRMEGTLLHPHLRYQTQDILFIARATFNNKQLDEQGGLYISNRFLLTESFGLGLTAEYKPQLEKGDALFEIIRRYQAGTDFLLTDSLKSHVYLYHSTTGSDADPFRGLMIGGNYQFENQSRISLELVHWLLQSESDIEGISTGVKQEVKLNGISLSFQSPI